MTSEPAKCSLLTAMLADMEAGLDLTRPRLFGMTISSRRR
jgi:hypothetical protein